MSYVDPHILYELFLATRLKSVVSSGQGQGPGLGPGQNVQPGTPLKTTPFTKMILDAIRTDEREELKKEFEIDNKTIDALAELDVEKDPDYLEKMENNRLGFYMEDFVISHMGCPICGKKTLQKYSVPNMPTVDLVCTNRDGHLLFDEKQINCFLFQVKIK